MMIKLSNILAVFTVLAGSSFAVAQQNSHAAAGAITSQADSAAFAFGLSIGQDLKRTGMETINANVVAQGIAAVFEGTETDFDEERVRELIMRTITEAREKMDTRLQEEANAFMEGNKAREGVQTTASGLQYEVVRQGEGEQPTAADSVTVHYRGQLSDGKVFDSSYDRGEPTTFLLGRVIEGWQEGLQLMPVGSHYRIYIPHELAYGERGAGQEIPPFSPLIFDVELISVQKGASDIPETGVAENEPLR